MPSRRVVIGVIFVVVAAAVLLAAVAVVTMADMVDRSGRATSADDCAGAAVEVTVGTVPEGQSVFVDVIVTDRDERRWEVKWTRDSRRSSIVTRARRVPQVLHAFEVMGDTDNGLSRSAWLRPTGAESWCEVSAEIP